MSISLALSTMASTFSMTSAGRASGANLGGQQTGKPTRGRDSPEEKKRHREQERVVQKSKEMNNIPQQCFKNAYLTTYMLFETSQK